MRITLSSATPEISARDVARFRVLVEPAVRSRQVEDGSVTTIGDVLDLEPINCSRRHMRYSEKTGYWSVRPAEPCGRRTCAWCVVDYLCKTVALAWVYWQGSADVLTVDARRTNRAGDVRLRGDNATPGALSVPHGSGRLIFLPGDILRGDVLDRELVRVLRAVPLERVQRAKREPTEAYANVPERWDTERIMQAAEMAGISVIVQRNGMIRATRPVSPEENHAFIQQMWGWRIDPGGNADARHESDVFEAHKVRVQAQVGRIDPGGSPSPDYTPDPTSGAQGTGVRTNRAQNGSTESYAPHYPTCKMCDSPDWHGWLHERYVFGGPYDDQMIKAHYPYTCGVGVAYEAEGKYRYPVGYLDMSGDRWFIKRGIHEMLAA
jgi:hypothetical protein